MLFIVTLFTLVAIAFGSEKVVESPELEGIPPTVEMAGPDGELPPNANDHFGERPTEPRRRRMQYDMPASIHAVKEGDMTRLQKSHELVVVLVIHPMACELCPLSVQQFKALTHTMLEDAGGFNAQVLGRPVGDVMAFAYINAEDEADEFTTLIGADNFHPEQLPLILILKRDVIANGGPPLSFAVNDQVSFKLPKFLIRAAGKPLAKIRTEEELVTRIGHPATQRVSIGIWADAVPYVLDNLIFDERLEFFFHHFPSPDAADEELVRRFNPDRADVVMYRYLPKEFHQAVGPRVADTVAMESLTFNRSLGEGRRLSDHQHRMASAAFGKWRRLRPGHEFDNIKRITVQDSKAPAACPRKVALDDRLQGQVVGRVTGSGTVFTDTRLDEFIIGKARIDLPPYVLQNGFMGLCEGQKRRIAFPPGQAYPEDLLPPGVTKTDRVTFYVHVVRFLEASENVAQHAPPKKENDHNPEEL